MDINELVVAKVNKSLKEGVIHLYREFKLRYSDFTQVTVESLEDWLGDVNRKMLEAESFSVEHCYYWSLSAYLTDMVEHARLIESF